jgi:hypothetical protein
MAASGSGWVGIGDPLTSWIGKQQTPETSKRDGGERVPSFDDLFGSKFLRAADLKGREATARIESVETMKMPDGKMKALLHFRGKDKALVLNKTNATRLAAAYGQDFAGWADKEVVLYPDETNFQGEMVPCLRVRVPQAAKPEPGDDGPLDW